MCARARCSSFAFALAVLVTPHIATGTVYTVAAPGGDFTVIQDALDAAVAGDTVLVHEQTTPYFERLVFPRSGSAGGGYITLQAAPGEQPVLDGTGVAGDQSMILIESRSYLKVVGFEIQNNAGVTESIGNFRGLFARAT